MSYKEIADHANAPYVEAVLRDTWGHLSPTLGKIYKGWILFGVSAFGSSNLLLIDYSFKSETKELESNPWTFEHVNEYLFSKTKFSGGNVYKFVGTYRVYKNGSYSFGGKFKRIKV